MKTIFLTLILILSFTTFAAADPKNPQQTFPKPNKRALLEKFDVNGDGKLSQEEREAAKSAAQQTRAAIIAKYDKDGDGKLNAQEREAAKSAAQQTRAAIIAKYDKDGDGKLNAQEREAAKEEFKGQ